MPSVYYSDPELFDYSSFVSELLDGYISLIYFVRIDSKFCTSFVILKSEMDPSKSGDTDETFSSSVPIGTPIINDEFDLS
jgi:hypothetical protein